MLSTYQYPKYEYQRPPELSGAPARRYPVVVIGAGPVGLAAAIDLVQRGVPVLLLDDDDTVSVGSRGLCYSKRALEILDRLGVGDAVFEKGVSWNVGRTFLDEKEVYNFNLLPQPGFKRPGMVNLQQYYLEEFEIARARQLPGLELRFCNKVVSVAALENGHAEGEGAALQVQTPDGMYALQCDWLIVADGARSPVRRLLGLDVEGRIFMDRFLIADVVMKADFPAERWFWFDPPFHRGQSVLLHREADNVYRIDFQLGWDADPEEAKKPENVIPRIRAMLGEGVEFELEWVSVYTFQCRRMQAFRHGRVLFAGDAAHQVSPFGARGANSGLQDTDNLAWKLQRVIAGKSPQSLLDTYSEERVYAADENLLNSTRSTDFITPKSNTSRLFRNAVLSLAREHDFARALVNSGRLSVAAFLTESRLNTPDNALFKGNMLPGAAMDDAPMADAGKPCWLLDQIGRDFALLLYVDAAILQTVDCAALAADLARGANAAELLLISAAPNIPAGALRVLHDTQGLFAKRYDAQPGTCYLLRPDQHVAARWRRPEIAEIAAALARATLSEYDARSL